MAFLIAVLPYIQITLSLLLIVAIILQQTGSGLGGALGGSDSGGVHYTRRGAEKVLFQGTFVLGVLFALASFIALLV